MIPQHDDAAVLAVLTSVFSVTWSLHLNGQNQHEAEQGLGVADIHVELDDAPGGHWSASVASQGEGLAWAYPGSAMEEPADLLAQGIQPGSLEELYVVLVALRFNAGQAIEEMRRAFAQATFPAVHHYVEPGATRATHYEAAEPYGPASCGHQHGTPQEALACASWEGRRVARQVEVIDGGWRA